MPLSANTVIGLVDITHDISGNALPSGLVNPYNQMLFHVYGNGTDSAVSYDLTKAPFNLDFHGNPPSLAYIAGTSGDNPTPMTTAMSGSSVILTFTPTIPSEVTVLLRWIYQAS